MERLTEKGTLEGSYFVKQKDRSSSIIKLGELEDIEEKLGCPLDIVIKALTRGVYVVDEQTKEIQCILRGLTTFTGSGLDTNYSGFIDERTWRKKVLYKGIEMPPMYYWKDYKKTWWLKEDKSE